MIEGGGRGENYCKITVKSHTWNLHLWDGWKSHWSCAKDPTGVLIGTVKEASPRVCDRGKIKYQKSIHYHPPVDPLHPPHEGWGWFFEGFFAHCSVTTSMVASALLGFQLPPSNRDLTVFFRLQSRRTKKFLHSKVKISILTIGSAPLTDGLMLSYYWNQL
jgi:hypothetical protein